MAITPQQFDQELEGIKDQLSKMGISPEQAKRKFFRSAVAPSIKGKSMDERAKTLSEWGIVKNGPDVKAVSNPIEAGVREFTRQGLNNTGSAQIIRAGAKAIGKPIPEAPANFYTTNLASEIAGKVGGTAAQYFDPINKIVGGAKIAGKVARPVIEKVAPSVAKAAEPVVAHIAGLKALPKAVLEAGTIGTAVGSATAYNEGGDPLMSGIAGGLLGLAPVAALHVAPGAAKSLADLIPSRAAEAINSLPRKIASKMKKATPEAEAAAGEVLRLNPAPVGKRFQLNAAPEQSAPIRAGGDPLRLNPAPVGKRMQLNAAPEPSNPIQQPGRTSAPLALPEPIEDRARRILTERGHTPDQVEAIIQNAKTKRPQLFLAESNSIQVPPGGFQPEAVKPDAFTDQFGIMHTTPQAKPVPLLLNEQNPIPVPPGGFRPPIDNTSGLDRQAGQRPPASFTPHIEEGKIFVNPETGKGWHTGGNIDKVPPEVKSALEAQHPEYSFVQTGIGSHNAHGYFEQGYGLKAVRKTETPATTPAAPEVVPSVSKTLTPMEEWTRIDKRITQLENDIPNAQQNPVKNKQFITEAMAEYEQLMARHGELVSIINKGDEQGHPFGNFLSDESGQFSPAEFAKGLARTVKKADEALFTPELREARKTGDYSPVFDRARTQPGNYKTVNRIAKPGEDLLGPDAKNLRGEPKRVIDEIARQQQPRPVAMPSAVDAVNPEKFLNFKKFDISEGEQANLRKMVAESVAETQGNPKPRITFEDIKQEAAAIDPALVANLKPVPEGHTLHPALRQAARDRLNTLNSQIHSLRMRAVNEQGKLPSEQIDNMQAQADGMERDAKGLIDVLYPTRSQDGRNLAFHRMMAAKSFDTEYWISRARRSVNGELPTENHARISSLVAEGRTAEQAGDLEGMRTARIGLAKELMKLEHSSMKETVVSVWKAGLLTSPRTHEKNILGNAGYAALEEVKRLPATLVDMAYNLHTKTRTTAGPNLGAMQRASHEAATKGIEEAKQILRHGATNDQLARLNLGRQLNSGNKTIDAYVNGVFNTLSAEDRVFRSYAYKRSIEEQARVMAINKKAGNIDAQARTLADKPTEEMIAQALSDAEFATFNNKNAVAEWIGSAKDPNVKMAVDIVMPFKNTPMNVIARVLDYAGVGVGKGVYGYAKAISGHLTPQEQRTFAEASGRGLTGWSLIYLGYKLAEKGLMTGTKQPGADKRNLNEAAGRPNASIKIGNTWYQVGGMSPWGNVMTIGAVLQRDAANPASIAAIAAKTAFDQPFMQGLSNVVDLAEDPAKFAPRWASNMAGSVVPNVVSDVAGLMDNKQRETDGPIEGIMRKIPGLRNQLPARQDALGQDIESDPVNSILPFGSRPAKENTDPAIAELVRLNFGLSKMGESVSTGKGKKQQLTPEQSRDMASMYGDAFKEKLGRMIETPRYKNLKDDDERKSLIHTLMNRQREIARRKTKQAIK